MFGEFDAVADQGCHYPAQPLAVAHEFFRDIGPHGGGQGQPLVLGQSGKGLDDAA